jgi:hypothetical protein
METQIKKLVSLAKEYCDYFQSIGTPNTWTTLVENGVSWKQQIRIYFANNYTTKQVSFFNVEVVLYSGMINIPFDYDTKILDQIITDSIDFLEKFKIEKEEEFKQKAEAKKIKRIAELEEELTNLKNK